MRESFDEGHKLDGSVQANLKKLLAEWLANPHVQGSELHGPPVGCYKVKLRLKSVRLV